MKGGREDKHNFIYFIILPKKLLLKYLTSYTVFLSFLKHYRYRYRYFPSVIKALNELNPQTDILFFEYL